MGNTSKLLSVVLIVLAIGGRAAASGAALRFGAQQRRSPRTTVAPRTTPLPRSVSFREVRGRGLLVDTWINSAGPFRFAVDTGTEITVISPRVAAEARVAVRSGPGTSIAGLSGAIVSATDATIENIALGESANYLPAKTNVIVSGGLPRDLDGLLSPEDAFGSLGYVIDIPRHELSLFDPHQSPLNVRTQPRDGAVVSWQSTSRRPFVLLDTGEKALIDTGSSLGFGVRDNGPAMAPSRSSAVLDVGGSVSAHRVAPRTVSIGSLVLRNVPTDMISGAASDAPALLGLNALRPFRLAFDPLHRLIEIAPGY